MSRIDVGVVHSRRSMVYSPFILFIGEVDAPRSALAFAPLLPSGRHVEPNAIGDVAKD